MTPSHDENRQISALTLDYYQRNAAGFQAGTRDHDVSQNIAALLRHIKGAPPYRILDFGRSEEHTSELQSLMRISYAVFCLKKKKNTIIEALQRRNQRQSYDNQTEQ